ncbi:hypothetical protein [Streptomyces odontomachi]|uniref:hypothetical protein n=1 Tax=Streptomyces odontomachi TaxID=2944940 RepID=UPI0027E2A784|nr:hypothetical protein [Streptomyces sp. ODS25]
MPRCFAQYANAPRFYGWDMTDCWSDVYWPSDDAALTDSMSYWAEHGNEYHLIYTAGPCALADLESTLGTGTMAHLLKTYARDHWYGVSTTAGFKAAAQSVTDVDLTPFWERHRIR